MRFDSEGTFPVRIKSAYLAESNFSEGEIEVAVEVETLDGRNTDHWHGELSQRYGVGNAADKMQWELTLATLEKIGWKHGTNFADDTLATLVGLETTATTKASSSGEKTYYNVRYLGDSGYAPKKVAEADAKAKLAALFGAGATAPPPPPAANAAPANANPFG